MLSWTAPNDDSITGYQVLRRRPSEGESALLVYVADTESTATTFTDTGVTAGVKHVYRVKAINAAGPERLVQLRQPNALGPGDRAGSQSLRLNWQQKKTGIYG